MRAPRSTGTAPVITPCNQPIAQLRKAIKLKLKNISTRWAPVFWRTVLSALDTKFPVPKRALISPATQAEIKSHLRAGDLLLETNSSYLGWQLATRLALNSNWMHSGIYVGDGLVVDAGSEPRVAKVSIDDFLKTTDIAIYRPDYRTDEDISKAVAYALKQVGKPFNYSFDTNDTKSFYCAQLVGSALSSMNNPINLPTQRMLWKRVIAPSSIPKSKSVHCIYSTKPTIFKSLINNWLVALGALIGAFAGKFAHSGLVVMVFALAGAAIVVMASNAIETSIRNQ